MKPFGTDRDEYFELLDFCKKEKIPVDLPFGDLDESARQKIINGTKSYYGIKGFFEWLETKTYKMHVRVYLSRYRAYVACDACGRVALPAVDSSVPAAGGKYSAKLPLTVLKS